MYSFAACRGLRRTGWWPMFHRTAPDTGGQYSPLWCGGYQQSRAQGRWIGETEERA